MKASRAAFDLIKQHEGLCLTAYLCPAKVPTIGYGHTRGVHLGQTISPEMADALLREDIEAVEEQLALMVHVPVTQGQWDALVSFAFNCGAAALANSTLLREINAGNAEAAADQFLRWTHAKGKQLPGLTHRREAERALFVSEAA